MNWSQILYSFIGSFFGFGFALIAEAFFRWWKNRNDRCRMIDNIKDELESIKNDIEPNQEMRVIVNFDTPIWNSVISTGIILKLLKTNKVKYDKILIIYNKIYALKKLEKDFNRNETLIYSTRSEIVKKIEEAIK